MVLLEPFILCFGALLLVFVACESGQRFSNAFSEVGGAFSQLDFYLLPIKIRRILPAVIIYMQEPMFVKFFGNLSATREQFKRVSVNLPDSKYSINNKLKKIVNQFLLI